MSERLEPRPANSIDERIEEVMRPYLPDMNQKGVPYERFIQIYKPDGIYREIHEDDYFADIPHIDPGISRELASAAAAAGYDMIREHQAKLRTGEHKLTVVTETDEYQVLGTHREYMFLEGLKGKDVGKFFIGCGKMELGARYQGILGQTLVLGKEIS